MKRFGLFVLVGLLSVVVLGLHESRLKTQRSTQRDLPSGDFQARRAWAFKEFGNHNWLGVEKWVRRSKLIQSDVGNVQQIAPIGQPNEFFHGFAESWSDMNLEVVGEKGAGVLTLDSVEVSFEGEVTGFGMESFWKSGGQKKAIYESGKGLLKEFEIEQQYRELLDYDAEDDPEVFHFLWDQFQAQVEVTFPAAQSPRDNKPMQGLRMFRNPLLLHRAYLLSQWGSTAGAVATLNEVADSALWRVRMDLVGDIPDRTRIDEDLQLALEVLRDANRLDADNEQTLKLARRRVVLHLQNLLAVPSPESIECQGVFYEAAVREVSDMSFFQRQLGDFTASHAGRGIFKIDDENRYRATVCLNLTGDKGSGTVDFRMREQDELPPIELFADDPRKPDYPLTFKSPKWQSTSGVKIKISAKTGEPLK